MSRAFMKALTQIISIVSTMAIGAVTVIGAQALNLMPFDSDGKKLSEWLASDPTVALWLQPGLFYLVAIAMLALAAISHANLSHSITIPAE